MTKKFFYEKKQSCCCVPIANATCAFLFHLTLNGCVIAIYVFTTQAIPPLNCVDYAFVGTALSLSALCVFTMFFIKLKRSQCWRSFLGFLLIWGILGNIALTIWYSIERWNADMKTLLLRAVRPRYRSADPIWYIWLVSCWITALLSIYYLVYILSCLCNTYKNHLFTDGYVLSFNETLPDTSMEVRNYARRFEDNKPYPVQRM